MALTSNDPAPMAVPVMKEVEADIAEAAGLRRL